MMHSMLFTALLTGLIYPTAAAAGTVDSNGIRVGSNTVTCRVDAGSGGGNGTNTATSYTWAFFWKYITNGADPVPTNGGLAWMLPAFSDTKHLVNCSVTSSRNTSAQSGSDEYLVTGGVPSVTHKILGMPVGDGEFGFGSLKSGNRSSGFTFWPNLDNTSSFSWGTPHNRSESKSYDRPEISTGFHDDQLWSSCWVFYGAYNDRSDGKAPSLKCEPRRPARQVEGLRRPDERGGSCEVDCDCRCGNHNRTERRPDPEDCGPARQGVGSSRGGCGTACGEYPGSGCGEDDYRNPQRPSESESCTPAPESGCDCATGYGNDVEDCAGCEQYTPHSTGELSDPDACVSDCQTGEDDSGECCGEGGAYADMEDNPDDCCVEGLAENCLGGSDDSRGEYDRSRWIAGFVKEGAP
ncbi:hypothetical protein BT67DRAFT_433413 [Trichocladium antarcticum]|uniref:Ig-like domain-containing protein n=1 Tax=Trichocladium antarcticum TaxID=1450529 RepID=A0AAN6ULK0_9PEZI|nr:hypothetical protein BT67DRAFT_433413 [Trichocladium antarcticum]